MMAALMRKNLTQEVAGAIFGVSQPTVSRRWDLLRPLIGRSWPAASRTRPRSPGRTERCWWRTRRGGGDHLLGLYPRCR